MLSARWNILVGVRSGNREQYRLLVQGQQAHYGGVSGSEINLPPLQHSAVLS